MSGRTFISAKTQIGIATVAVVGIILSLLVFIWYNDRDLKVRSTQVASADHAQTLAEHAARTFETVDVTLSMFARLIETTWETSGTLQVSQSAILNGAASHLPQVRSITVFNASGRLVGSGPHILPAPSNVSGTSFFVHHSKSASDALYIGDVVKDAVSGEWRIAVTRRLNDPSGDFGGVIVADVDPTYFRDFYDQVSGADQVSSALLSRSEQILASSSRFLGISDDTIGQTLQPSGSGNRFALRVRSATLLPEAEEHFAVSVPVTGWPLIAIVAFAESDILASGVHKEAGLAAAAILVIFAGIVAFMSLSRTYGVQVLALEQAKESRSELAARVSELEQSKLRLERQGAQLKEMAEELIIAKQSAEQGNRAKSQFLAQMSHELRTPLNAILGFSEIIRDQVFGPDQPKRYAAYADDIHSSGRHLLDIINDILDLSKIEAGKMELAEELVDVATIVDEVVRIVGARAFNGGLDLQTDVMSDLPRLRADRRALKQILINLVNNAVKYTPDGGSVTVSAAIVDDACRLSVTDTGIGIDQDDLPRILAPFGQVTAVDRSRGGTGLGLPIVVALVQLHSGSLDIDSTPGEGSTFAVTLPAERLQSQAGAA